jgi:[glutamine synthetase] adenylyltransferase / [glutamine synthetase]-adenylyl-L-tyrosine phosphorylase
MLLSVADRLSSNATRVADLNLFRDEASARHELDILKTRLTPESYAALPPLLAELPDPGQALRFMERLAEQSPDALARLESQSQRALLHRVLLIFGHSYWLGETLLKDPDLLSILGSDKNGRDKNGRDRNMERSLERDDFRERLERFCSRFSGAELPLLLARFRKREYVRIALRDLLGTATLAETTAEISALSDVLIEAALGEAQKQMRSRYGIPEQLDERGRRGEAPFAVLALGKLGGNELNYSSDVDLLYLYDATESLPGGISAREFFIRQAQLVTEMLSRTTSEGSVFRIDLRLRPQGHEGEPAVALRHALHYYSHSAQDWELQALIKARYSAGAADLARRFIQAIQPRVYTANINFAAIETMVNSRRKIGEHRRRSLALRKEPATIDVKLDRGGIRDIEFLAQCLQRVYGGEESWLRACGTLFALRKLHDKGHLSSADFHDLSAAYEFLRALEHRLQLQRGQQLHRLPAEAAQLEALASAIPGENPGGAGLVRALRERMGRVAAIYERIIHHQKQREKGGVEAAAADSYFIGARELAFDQLVRRIESDSPALFQAIPSSHPSDHARRNLHRFLGAAMASPERYNVLLQKEAPGAIASAVTLFESSDYLSDILVRQPQMLRTLNEISRSQDGRRLEPAGKVSLQSSGRNLNESVAMLRRKFHQASFAIAANDVLLPRPAFVSLKLNSRMADEAVRAALRIVNAEHSLAVFALGRLGTEEFDIRSDADLLFVRAPNVDEQEARLDAERLVHALAAYTKEGPLFAVDARLRPHGAEGELVTTWPQLERYLAEEAQPWQALTYSKLRFLAGREDVKPLALAPVWHQIVEIAARPGFRVAVQEMRARLEKSNRYPGSFKLAAGGFYDVDFIASYLMLTEANLTTGNTEDKLQHLRQAGLLPASTADTLLRAALLYRTADHAIRLVTGRDRPELPAIEHQRQAVEKLVATLLGRPMEAGLQLELQRTQTEVRRIFVEIVK